MPERPKPDENLLIVGANHRSSSMTLRDRLFIDEAAAPGFFARLRKSGVQQAMVFSTWDRVEIVAIDAGEDTAVNIQMILADHAGVSVGELDDQTYVIHDDDAVRHLFAVTSSLDSLVVGEPQILGQVKASHRYAHDNGFTGPALEKFMRGAYNVAKRVRTETDIGRRPVSIAAAAVQTARDLHGNLGGCAGLLIGTGEMGEIVAEALLNSGLSDLVVTHPSARRAEELGRRLDCHVAAFDTLDRLFVKSDIVMTAMSTRRYVVENEAVEKALGERRHRPVFLIDMGVPGDIEPNVDNLEDAFRFTLDDLERVTREGRANREAEAEQARQIVEAEANLFARHRAERTAVPTVQALRQRFEQIRDQALKEAGGDAEKATHLLVSRLLHEPSETLRALAAKEVESSTGDWDSTVAALDALFGLDRGKEDEGT